MSDFTPEQQSAIMTYYQNFQMALGERTCDAGTAESLLANVFPDLDPEKLHRDCLLMEAGVRRFMDAYENSHAQSGGNAADALDSLTKDMNAQQRKGFYLSVYDTLREADCANCQEAVEAQEGRELVREMDEDELKDLVSRQVTAHAQVIAAESAEAETTEASLENTTPDPMLMAMANYAASLDGTLPEYFEKSPEFMGIFAASSCMMTKTIQENPEKAKDKAWIYELVVSIVGIALLAALAAWCAPIAIEGIQQLIVAISTGNFGVLLTRFKYPLLHFLRNARFFLPAAVLAALNGLSDVMDEAAYKLRNVYGSVKSRVRAMLGKAPAEDVTQAVTEAVGELPEEEDEDEEEDEEEEEYDEDHDYI